MLSAAKRRARRNALYQFQNGRCFYCDKPMVKTPSDASRFKGFSPKEIARRMCTLEHLTPISAGGTDAWGNIVAACYLCNVSRRTVPWEIFRDAMRARRARSDAKFTPADDVAATQETETA